MMLTKCIKRSVQRCAPVLLSRNIWSDAYRARFSESELDQKIRKLLSFDRAEISRTMTLSIPFPYHTYHA